MGQEWQAWGSAARGRGGSLGRSRHLWLPLKTGHVKHAVRTATGSTWQLQDKGQWPLRSALRTHTATLPSRATDCLLGSGTDKSSGKSHPMLCLTCCWFQLLLDMVHQWVNFITSYNIHWNEKGDMWRQPFLPALSLTPHPPPITTQRQANHLFVEGLGGSRIGFGKQPVLCCLRSLGSLTILIHRLYLLWARWVEVAGFLEHRHRRAPVSTKHMAAQMLWVLQPKIVNCEGKGSVQDTNSRKT